MLPKIRFLQKGQAGFTLIELMASLAITGLIGLGAAVSSAQVVNQTTRNQDFTTANRNVMNAVHWISRDAQMAQVISGYSGFPQSANISFAWVDWSNVSHNATYELQNGQLRRNYNVNGEISSVLIAEYINPDAEMTYCSSENGTLTLTITASVGEGSKIIDVTRVRDMTSRPKL